MPRTVGIAEVDTWILHENLWEYESLQLVQNSGDKPIKEWTSGSSQRGKMFGRTLEIKFKDHSIRLLDIKMLLEVKSTSKAETN